MKVDAGLSVDLSHAARSAADAEATGYSGVWTVETAHDPFLPLVLAAEHSAALEIGTSIAVGFARNPMTLANLGWDLQTYSRGRFILGLGSQIKPHIEKRFSMPWGDPARRMREMVLAIREIWASWLEGSRLAFRGEYYRHTLMTPVFSPSPSDLEGFGPPPIYLAGVGEMMTEVCGEVADGFICHAFTTETYLREVTIPALARGRARAGRTMEGFDIVGPGFVVTGADEPEIAAAARATRTQVAFYGSTPAYRGVLETHGWGDLQDDLNSLSKQGRWAEMGELIDDSILSEFAIIGEPESIPAAMHRRFGDVITRACIHSPRGIDPGRWSGVVAAMKGA